MISGSVTSGSVISGSVTSGSVISGSVTSGSVISGSVTSGSVISGSVTSGSVISGSVPSGAGVAKPYSARYASASSGVAGTGDTPLENTIAMVTGGWALSALLVKYSGSSGT